MISASNFDPGYALAASSADYRMRVSAAERTMLQDSTHEAPRSPGTGDHGQFAQHDRETPAQPDHPVARDPASMFAAAVIAGALPPVPQTMEQLIQRIGISAIPEESEARLKNLLV